MEADLNPTEDQTQILDAARAMLQASYPLSRLHGRAAEDMAEIAQFGTFALALPEDAGGTGFTLVEEALLHVLFGRHLVDTTAWATPLAARLAVEQGKGDLATSLAEGQTIAAAALVSGDDLLLFGAPRSHAFAFADGKALLIKTEALDTKTETGLGHDLSVTRVTGNWHNHIVASGDNLQETAAILCAAQLLGMAEATSDLSVDYAQTRHQFGQPIGTFQAVKHRAADMALGTEMLSATLDMAAIAQRDDGPEAPFQAAALTRLAPRIALQNARSAIQIHGGMGFSDEADAHWFVKRVHLMARLMPPLDILGHKAPLAPFTQERQI